MPTHVKSPNERHVRVRLDPGGMQGRVFCGTGCLLWLRRQVGNSFAPGTSPQHDNSNRVSAKHPRTHGTPTAPPSEWSDGITVRRIG